MSKQVPQKSRLGRGLSSLMNLSAPPASEAPSAEQPAGLTATAAASGVMPVSESPAPASAIPGVVLREIPLDNLAPNPHQPRCRFDETALKELADSLKSTGMIQPVVARATTEDRFELIAGERRWRAAKIAGLTTLPVILRTVDPVMQAQMALVENLQRQDLNPIERATAYKALLDNLGLTQGELADRLGEDRSVIGHHVRLLDLAAPVQDLIADEKISLTHARTLVGVSDPDEQVRLANLVVAQGLSVKNLERLVATPAAAAGAPAAAPKSASAHLVDLEKTMSRQLGMRVQVKSGKQKGRGRLILHYASLDQFDDLMSKLGLESE